MAGSTVIGSYVRIPHSHKREPWIFMKGYEQTNQKTSSRIAKEYSMNTNYREDVDTEIVFRPCNSI